MITVRPADKRGHVNHGWLDTYHSFSFAGYYDKNHMGFRALRVLNDDTVAPGEGFGAHAHHDMEIISYVVEGALAHQDSLGKTAVLRPGDVQSMSAGTGVTHSEYNGSDQAPVHFLQIWLTPAKPGLAPRHAEKHFSAEEKQGRLRIIASPDGRDGSLRIEQDASLFASVLNEGQVVRHALANGRHAWVQVVRGNVTLNGVALSPGDGAAVSDEPAVRLAARGESEVFLLELQRQSSDRLDCDPPGDCFRLVHRTLLPSRRLGRRLRLVPPADGAVGAHLFHRTRPHQHRVWSHASHRPCFQPSRAARGHRLCSRRGHDAPLLLPYGVAETVSTPVCDPGA
jgi:redox-sensitive bicupin YhaK (pirin superfamily)